MGRLRVGLDSIDIELLRVLARNCRVKLKDLSRILGISEPMVRRRLKRLVETGVIKSCSALVDPEVLGSLVYLVTFKAQPASKAEEALRDLDAVERIYYSTNRGLGVAIVKVVRPEELDEVVSRLKSRGFEEVDTILLDQVVLERSWAPGPSALSVELRPRCAFCGAPIIGEP